MKSLAILILLFFFTLNESQAGITGSFSLGFGRYRNQNSPKNFSQPVGLTLGAAGGYKFSFVSLEAAYYRFSGCSQNTYSYMEYETCAKDSFYGLLSRFYIFDAINIIAGYARHNITHNMDPSDSDASEQFRYDKDNRNGGIVYGVGGKTSIAGGIDFFFDALLCAIGNEGNQSSSEIDLFMGGFRFEF